MKNARDYQENTLGLGRTIDDVFTPTNKQELKKIIQHARNNNLKLWPISSGRNWGYGSALPVEDNNIIVDLGKLNEISFFDRENGIITLGPGVTQIQLYEFLKDTDYITPSTGAGPDVSILSNLLERGYGLAPIQDHFSSLVSLKAYLADGREYNSSLCEIVGDHLGKKFKWGIGPFLNGIFTQSNFAIVTEVTIMLARRAKNIELVKFSFEEDKLEEVINCLKESLQNYPSLLSGINLMNKERMSAMGVNNANDWTGIFSINADKEIVKHVKSSIHKRLKKHARVAYLTQEKINFLKRLPLPKKIKQELAQAEEMFYILRGRPTKMALNLCYLKNNIADKTFNPDKDNCGLIWYSPLVEMNIKSIKDYVAFVKETCLEFNIAPLITLTSLGHTVFDSTVPIIFSKDSQNNETLNAHNCYNKLLAQGQMKGYYPYRMGIGHMKNLTDAAPVFFDIAKDIKKALDPQGIIAPQRYSKK